MNGMILTYKLTSGRSWTEESPKFDQRSTETWGADFGSKVLNIYINGLAANVRAAIAYIVGYSECVSVATGQRYDPANPAIQAPFKLKHYAPARHPINSGLRATKILSVTGTGKRNLTNDGAAASRPVDGTTGQYFEALVSILFEIPKYPIMSDDENSLAGTPRPEYRRYTLWEPTEAMETIARKGQTWTFMHPAARAVQVNVGSNVGGTVGADRLLRQAKGGLKVTTFDVAMPFVFLGRMIPSNGLNRLSTLNAAAFPYDADLDQNTGLKAQFRPGVLLMLPSKYTQHAQCHPALLNGQVSADFFPQTLDVERNFLFFDPPSTDTTTIDLNAYATGNAGTLVRGHNLAPLNSPITAPGPQRGSIWFTAKSTPFVTGQISVTASELLYPYSDFEKLWQAPESMPAG